MLLFNMHFAKMKFINFKNNFRIKVIWAKNIK